MALKFNAMVTPSWFKQRGGTGGLHAEFGFSKAVENNEDLHYMKAKRWDRWLVCCTQVRTVHWWCTLQAVREKVNAWGEKQEVNRGSGGSPQTKMHISSRPFQHVIYFPWTSCPLFSTFCSKVEKERNKRRILAAAWDQSWCWNVHALSLFATIFYIELLVKQNV